MTIWFGALCVLLALTALGFIAALARGGIVALWFRAILAGLGAAALAGSVFAGDAPGTAIGAGVLTFALIMPIKPADRERTPNRDRDSTSVENSRKKVS